MAIRDYVAKYQADLTKFNVDPAIRATEELETSSKDAAKGIDKAFDAVSLSSKDMADDVAKNWRHLATGVDKAADDAGHHAKGKFGELGQEVGGEFTQNLGEAISSGQFNGQTLTGTIGGLAGSLGATGPIGAAFAGLATLATVVFAGITAAAAKTAAAVSTEFDAIISGQIDQATKDDRLKRAFGVDTVSEAVAAAVEAARHIPGMTPEEYIKTLTGDTPAGMKARLQAIVREGTKTEIISGRTSTALTDSAASAQTLLDHMKDLTVETSKAGDEAFTYQNTLDLAARTKLLPDFNDVKAMQKLADTWSGLKDITITEVVSIAKEDQRRIDALGGIKNSPFTSRPRTNTGTSPRNTNPGRT